MRAWDCSCGTRNAPSFTACRKCGRAPTFRSQPTMMGAPAPRVTPPPDRADRVHTVILWLAGVLLLLFLGGWGLHWLGRDTTAFDPGAGRVGDLVLSSGPRFYSDGIAGTVTNTGDRTYSYVQIEINLYDEGGAQVGSTMANVNNLEPHGRWRFVAPVLEGRAHRCKVKGITAY